MESCPFDPDLKPVLIIDDIMKGMWSKCSNAAEQMLQNKCCLTDRHVEVF